MLFLKQTMRRLLLLMSLFGLKVKQLNSARRQIRRNGEGGGGGLGGHNPVAGFCDFRLCGQQKHQPHLSSHYRGVGKSIGRAFLSISPAPRGLDRTRLRQMIKMERHKQCQKLGGSGNADLRPPQGVTSQTLYIYVVVNFLSQVIFIFPLFQLR